MNKSKLIARAITLLLGAALLSFGYNALENQEDVSKSTTLQIQNYSEQDSVLAYLTIGADTNFITNVKGVFGIKDSGLQGSFWIKKDSIYSYEYLDKGISGNITFDTVPLNCPTGSFKSGVNLFEFTLNNEGTVSKAQETFDISGVAGTNAIGGFYTSGGGDWIVNGNSIDSVYNDTIYHNTGLKGVFPFKCTDCTSFGMNQNCLGSIKSAEPQSEHICNISRNASESGGTVTIYIKNSL